MKYCLRSHIAVIIFTATFLTANGCTKQENDTPGRFGGGSKKIQAEVDAFNRINKQIAGAYNVVYVDITPISKQAETDQSFTTNDGLHPSAKQYAQWALLTASLLNRFFNSKFI